MTVELKHSSTSSDLTILAVVILVVAVTNLTAQYKSGYTNSTEHPNDNQGPFR